MLTFPQAVEPCMMTLQFFRDFYDSDAAQVRTDRYKSYTLMLDKYRQRNDVIGPWQIDR